MSKTELPLQIKMILVLKGHNIQTHYLPIKIKFLIHLVYSIYKFQFFFFFKFSVKFKPRLDIKVTINWIRKKGNLFQIKVFS